MRIFFKGFPHFNYSHLANHKFLSEVHPEKYLKMLDYHIMKERAFASEDVQGFKEVIEMLQQRWWVSFNNLIRETNKIIGLEFYTNADFGAHGTYQSYVWGKYIDYSPTTINLLFDLESPYVCTLRNYRQEYKVMTEALG